MSAENQEPAWINEDCPGGLPWTSCHASDCGVDQYGEGCDLAPQPRPTPDADTILRHTEIQARARARSRGTPEGTVDAEIDQLRGRRQLDKTYCPGGLPLESCHVAEVSVQGAVCPLDPCPGCPRRLTS